MAKATSVEDFKQVANFQTLRRSLLVDGATERLEKPLAYWALPNDRRLPMAFLGRPLQELLNTPYEQLAATPGIGRKKIGSMLKLLARAAKEPASHDGAGEIDRAGEIKPAAERLGARGQFDAAAVSEALWHQWRETVRRCGLVQEPLGRLAPSLLELPTVIWRLPLAMFLDYSLAELRKLKTYGEKRVRVVLEVFYAVHEAVGRAQLKRHLAFRLIPSFVAPLETWIADCTQHPQKTTVESVRECLAAPLVAQIQIDCGATVARLVDGRLGLHAAPQNVRTQSKRMGVTRARIYQLLEQCQRAIEVRWPLGKCLVSVLLERSNSEEAAADGFEELRNVAHLLFPDELPSAHGQAAATEREAD